MKKPLVSELTLRQKIGQTGMPSPPDAYFKAKDMGGFVQYFSEYPFAGLYLNYEIKKHSVKLVASASDLAGIVQEASDACEIPLLVSCDAELGGKEFFDGLHRIPSNMSLGAARSKELTYLRSYYYARELRSFGINWQFGPVCDLLSNFFCCSGIRCMSDQPEAMMELLPEIIRGFRDAGVMPCAKHYPGTKGEYRDSHFCTAANRQTKEQWDNSYRKIWQTAVDANVESIMVSHAAFPAVDPSFTKNGAPTPSTASKEVLDILREEMGYQGVILTDAISMKGLAAALSHEDIYIECFNAGNDLILFCWNDYIDVMEKAVLDGRVSMERLDRSVQRILDMKEKLGLFEIERDPMPLTDEETRKFDQVVYDIGKAAITLINNHGRMIPFAPDTVKRVTVINLAPYRPFFDELKVMVQAFEEKDIQVTLLERLHSKEQLEELSKTEDIIIYACYLAQSRPSGMSFYSRPEDMLTLFHGLSHGADKSVVVSFGAPSIYYNYFESANAYLNAYSSDAGTMRAFVDGILGAYEFTGKSPVALYPKFADD